jgi:DNA-directed RNA polymerase subunit RPC12/RpoP
MNGTEKRIRVSVTCSTCHERLSTVAKPYDREMPCPECGATIKVKAYDPVEAEFQARLREPRNVDPGVYSVSRGDEPPPTAQAETISMKCPICGTLLHPEVRDEAWSIRCPDCLEEVRVPARSEIPVKAKPKPIPSPGEYAVGVIHQAAPMSTQVYDQISAIKEKELDPPPKWTFFSQVFGYPWSRHVWHRWLWMSIGWMVDWLLIAQAIDFLMMGGYMGVAAAFMALPAIWVTFLALSYTVACCLTIIEDTGNGIQNIDEWPEPDWREWMVNLIYLGFLFSLGQVLVYFLGSVAGPALDFLNLSLILVCAIYPVILLSSLESGSAMIPFSKGVFVSMLTHFRYWVLYYVISAGVTFAWGVSVYYSLRFSFVWSGVWQGMLIATLAIVQARLVGRLAWRVLTEPDGGKQRRRNMKKRERMNDPLATAIVREGHVKP